MTGINHFSDKTSLYHILLLTVCLLANPLLGGIALNLHFQSRRYLRHGRLRGASALAKQSVAMAASGLVMSFFILLLVGIYFGGSGGAADQQGPQPVLLLPGSEPRPGPPNSNPKSKLNSDSHHRGKGSCGNHHVDRERILNNAPMVPGDGHVGGGGGGRNNSNLANLY